MDAFSDSSQHEKAARRALRHSDNLTLNIRRTNTIRSMVESEADEAALRMAKIFVSHTSADADWASWIGFVLEEMGHKAFVDTWEISGGQDIMDWMDEHMEQADHVLVVLSQANRGKIFADWERRSALWKSKGSKLDGFVLPVFIDNCEASALMTPLRACTLMGLGEQAAFDELKAFLTPAVKPASRPRFPGELRGSGRHAPEFPPTKSFALTNVPLPEPEHFLGRDEALEKIGETLTRQKNSRVVITALHGLHGVGKSTLAAAYSHRTQRNWRATWWIAAQTEATLRADLAGLGVKMGWVDRDAKEEGAVTAVLARLRGEGDGILLIFDNANSVEEIRRYLPINSGAKMLVTSNDENWRAIAETIEIDVWPQEIGAEFLIERTGRNEPADAVNLSRALGGLPLAHEQAGAYCERLGVSFTEYLARFEEAPTKLLNSERDASLDYHNRQTVAKAFAMAIEKATKLHSAAARLIEYLALLPPEPIPLFYILEGRENLCEILSVLDDEGLDEAVASLRSFALVYRETVEDERNPSIRTETIRLHRLVRVVASERLPCGERKNALRSLIEAAVTVFPDEVGANFECWPRARRLYAVVYALVMDNTDLPTGTEVSAVLLLHRLASFNIFLNADIDAAIKLYAKLFKLVSQKRIDLAAVPRGFIARIGLKFLNYMFELAMTPKGRSLQKNLRGGLVHITYILWEWSQISQLRSMKRINNDEFKLRQRRIMQVPFLDASHFFIESAIKLKEIGGIENIKLARMHLDRALQMQDQKNCKKFCDTLCIIAEILTDLGGDEDFKKSHDYLLQAKQMYVDKFGIRHRFTKDVSEKLSKLEVAMGLVGSDSSLADVGGKRTSL
jgi:hypothetical protein